MSSPSHVIAFIGAGNLARSLIGGLIKQAYPSNKIIATRRNLDSLRALEQEFGIHGYLAEQNSMAIEQADVIVLAVKPMFLQEVSKQIGATLQAQNKQPLIISLAAGILIKDIQRWLGYEANIIRSMSNTPALIGEGASVLYASETTTLDQKIVGEKLLQSVGKTCWVDSEKSLNDLMPLVSSGPGYAFFLVEQFIEAAVRMGISRDVASRMATQTFYGALKLAVTSTESLEQLRQRVTTPNGITHQGIVTMERYHLDEIFQQAMQAGAKRGNEYAEIFGKDVE